MANIGFIGTGIMGTPMARNLQNSGHTLYFSELYKATPAELLGTDGIAVATPAEVARAALLEEQLDSRFGPQPA